MTMRFPAVRASLVAMLLLLPRMAALAQAARPAGAVAATAPGDTAARSARQVRAFPIVFGGAAVGGGLGLLAGAAGGAALGSTADDGRTDSIISGEGIGAILGGGIGYAVGAALGAHFTASSSPRPNPAAVLAVSVLYAAAAGVAAGALGSAGLSEGTTYVLVAAVPVAHLALTSQFARWRAQRR